MGIKSIQVNNLSSFIDFNFDITNRDGSFGKYITIFGTNGSGKSTLVNLLDNLNRYTINLDNEEVVKFFQNKISKESVEQKIDMTVSFNDNNYRFLFDSETNKIQTTGNFQKLKIFNENYTNKTIGSVVDINFQENGLIIGEPNKELDKERTKLKKLEKQKKQFEKDIAEAITAKKKEYTSTTGSTSKSNLEKFSKEELLKGICSYEKDDTLIEKRYAIGKRAEEQKSKIIDISKANSFFDLNKWEELFNEIIVKPTLSEEYQTLLIKYSDFYNSGAKISKDSDLNEVCPYCLQQWDRKDIIFNEFEEYLSSDYNRKKGTIESLKIELKKFTSYIEEKNKEIELQDKIVVDECAKYDVDSSSYKVITFEQVHIDSIIDLMNKKITTMNESLSIKDQLYGLQSYYYQLLQTSIAPLLEIKEKIGSRQSLVMSLNTQIAEHMMGEFWDAFEKNRNSYKTICELIVTCNEKIEELELQNEDINTIQEVFNGLVKFIGLEEYYLDENNKLQLKIESSYDISTEGGRISSAQRKILSLCYFYAELISTISHEKELKDYIIVYDDPVDSADYIFFHSITSLIENIESVLATILKKESVSIGQHIVFTHNSLLFNRLTQNSNLCKKMKKVENKTQLLAADKIENNYKVYLEMIVDFYKKDDTAPSVKMAIGNIIRRVLEVIISFNELNSNNVSIVKDYGKPTLGMIANHLSHENFSKILNPLPTDDEMKKACEELFDVIKVNHPKQFEYIEQNLLNI